MKNKRLLAAILSAGLIGQITTVSAEEPAVSSQKGDINADGSVDITDLTELSVALVDHQSLTESKTEAADINKNGVADLTDLATLRQYISKQIESLYIPDRGTIQAAPVPTAQIPDKGPAPGSDYIWPLNREDNHFDTASFKGNTYSKRCIFTFDEGLLNIKYYDETLGKEVSVNPFFEDTVNSTGIMGAGKTAEGIGFDEMILLKCGNEEGRYFVFINNTLSEERTSQIYEKFGITDYAGPSGHPSRIIDIQPSPTIKHSA